MSQPKLILSRSIPFKIPLRFFFTAPLFGVLAAIFILWQGPLAFTTRWSPGVVAVTHLMVLGYIVMVMLGALLQVVSVLTGARLPGIKRTGLVTYLSLTAGTLLLSAGLVNDAADLIRLAIVLLALSFILFCSVVIMGLLTAQARSDAAGRMWLALISLVLTVALGIWLATGYAWDNFTVDRTLTDIHLTWGLLGWISLLVMTVAYEVVPMFQLTPAYPKVLTRWLSMSIFFGLIAWSGGILLANAFIVLLGSLVLACGLFLFALTTLWLQKQRKKKQPNVTVWFWFCAMLCLIAAIGVWVSAQFYLPLKQAPSYALMLGVLMIAGFAISVINGMLYKIIPFLCWVHLSMKVTELGVSRRHIPNIKTFINNSHAHLQLLLHLLALLLIVVAILYPELLLIPAAVFFALSNILLCWNLFAVLQVYKKSETEIIANAMA
ncbi:MAG: hypothetical protein OQL06_14295 [Gammaproteobacteria bacterium]|nr:hypothetical protein [Gammaproteobacteria bacterium]